METLFLSQLKLNPHNRQVSRDLGDCQQLHRTILGAFPQTESQAVRAEFDVLFRIDVRPSGSMAVLVQSKLNPDWTQLPTDYLLELAQAKPVAALYENLQPGQRLRFRLRANPTKRLPILIENRQGKERGKRIDLRREEDQLAWLEGKAGQHGFRLLRSEVNSTVPNILASPGQKIFGHRNGKRMTFGSALFEGELEITDAAQFLNALRDGIGSGKAYGFGLLSIAPSCPNGD
jgi:CRISPR system Cascade subunit CasE